MHWQRLTTLGALLLALAALAAWQVHEYGHECELARESVASAADSVMNALVGGVRSHRRMGLFLSQQIQGVLEGLTRSKDVRAVALVSEDGKSVLAAGEVDLLDLAPPFASGEYWDAAGFRLVHAFQLPLETGGPGAGRGSGFGGGPGWGRRREMEQETENAAGAFMPGQAVAAILLVNRDRTDRACRHAVWLRGSIVVAGWLVVICVAMAWRATVSLAESRGRQRTLEIEARHLRDLSQAAAGLAHETRNPLGLIRGWTQRLADAGANCGDGRQQARAVMEECDRVTARINQFLAFARPREPKLDRFDPADVIGELAVLLEPDLNAKQVTLSRMASGTSMLADRELFRQAMFNLLQNAVQASPENAIVENAAGRGRQGQLRIEVLDRGPGVPAEAADRLFTPYYTTRAGGTGLGLAMVRGIAATHGWEVGYTPRPGGGAIFWLDAIHG
jgi:signal transduction histidine kinase